MTDSSHACPVCGKPVTRDAPQALCPECLMKCGFETKSGADFGKSAPPPVDDLAELFPHLEIFGSLGHGGMGCVYKARQSRLNRLVALKILSPERQVDPQFAARFEREARALASLSHPNIVAVYDFGEVRGRFYLLMEFVDGLTLRQLYRTRGLPPADAPGIVLEICQALQYAHEQGVVHRDIKPENILLGKEGRVKIADFGVAKILGLEHRDLLLTGAKDVVGTPHYMAPEQIERPQAVDSRADIYSLGVVFYEMLTGELPLGKFQAPSRKAPIDVRLDDVVLHALEKEPDHRYQKIGELKTDVETIAATAGATRRPLIAPRPSAKKSNGWRIVLLAGGFAGFVLLALLLFMLPPLIMAPRPIAWWRADGNALDSAGTNNGALVNGVKFTPGIRADAFLFDGNAAYVKIPASSRLNPGNQITIEFWMRAVPQSLESYEGLVGGDFYLVEISNGSRAGRKGVNFAISTDGGNTIAQTADVNGGGSVISTGQWHFIAAVYDGHDLQLYIDGKPSGKPLPHSGLISPMLSGGFLSIGSEDGRATRPQCIGTRYFKGAIDDVKIYDLALSPGTIVADYRHGIGQLSAPFSPR
ncbi:MAG: protein kinase [Verrucomicrobia bacterium]|nr:protein kinase [Verrucomicrobiota bacterium]MDE3099907.1 protein kinase [Verrucomicrobiota bacterium]